ASRRQHQWRRQGTQQPTVSRIPKRYGAIEAAAGELVKPRIKGYALNRPGDSIPARAAADSGRHAGHLRLPASPWHCRSALVTSRASPDIDGERPRGPDLRNCIAGMAGRSRGYRELVQARGSGDPLARQEGRVSRNEV